MIIILFCTTVIAFSGGVDSSLAAYLVQKAFDDNLCIAVTGISKAFP